MNIIRLIVEDIKEDPKEFFGAMAGFATLFAICLMIAGIGV